MAKNKQLPDLDLITSREAAAILKLNPLTLRNWRCKGIGPEFYRVGALGSACLYRRTVIEAWLKTREVRPVGKAA